MFSFGTAGAVPTTQPSSFAFGSTSTTPAIQPSFTFGSTSTAPSTQSSTFPFGGTTATTSTQPPTFGFGSTSTTPAIQPVEGTAAVVAGVIPKDVVPKDVGAVVLVPNG
ncbi:unnamed protein product, partial [Rotaria sp. Silwood2]